MKNILCILASLFSSSTLLATNYYWVGGTGTWSDYATHWATSSGGTVFHVTIPSPADDVYFDANSFPTTGDTLYLDTTITNCRTMDWSAVTNTPTFQGNSINLQVYGSLIISPSMNWNTGGALRFKSKSQGNVINTNGVTLAGPTYFNIYFEDTGSWQLQSSLTMGSSWYQGTINITAGTLYTNGFPVTCSELQAYITNTPCGLFLGNSTVTCNGDWDLGSVSSTNFQLDAASSFLQVNGFCNGGTGFTYNNVSGANSCGGLNCIFNDVSAGGISGNQNTFHNVTCNSITGSSNVINKVIMSGNNCSFTGSHQVDTLIFSGTGQHITMTNSILTVNDMQGPDGSCAGLSSITGDSPSGFSKSAGIITINYVRLQDVSASGGATFIANNSIDGGSVSGFTINNPAPQNLFWVGGTGNWDDVNHWSTSSGGAGGSCVPNQFDDIFFDANSFPSANDTVYGITSTALYCRTMDWSAVTNTPTFQGNSINLQVYGSLIISPSMNWNTGGALRFKSKSQGNVINTNGVTLAGPTYFNIYFEDTGSWQLQSSLTMGSSWYQGSINLFAGILYTNGFPVTCSELQAYITNTPCGLFLGNSTVTCNGDWDLGSVGSTNFQLDAANSFLQVNGFCSAGSGFTYNNVSGANTCAGLNCIFNDVNAGGIGGNQNTFHNVICNAITGSANVINKVIMSGNGCSLGGSHQIDSLIFNNPGQTITIQASDTITCTQLLVIQSDPGFPSTIQCNGGTATISKPSDTVCTDFIYLQNITATGGALFFAGDHSVDLGGNSGWNWIRCAPLISNVWPGDCNYDLITDNFDLLNIGVAYGDTGYVRPGASLTYIAQPCQDWYYQFINAVNVKHADCDGNGIVDGPDSTAISLNYGLTHPARLMKPDETNSVGAELAFDIPPAVVPGSVVSVPITLGTSVEPADNVYGIAFTVDYDPAFIQSGTMSIDYLGSWVENSNNHLHLEKDFPGAGKTDIAFTRIDHADISGFGMIATLNFVVSPNASGPFNMSFSHVRVISHNEIEVPVHTNSGNTYVGIEENGSTIPSVVFPNPMTDQTQIFFSNPSHEKWTLVLKDVTGRIIDSEKTTTENIFLIERKRLGSGVYIYSIYNSEGKSSEGKIIVR